MDLNQKVIQRQGYTTLDLISDIGGLQGILISVFAIIVGIWNHNMLENLLVSRLFKLEAKPEPDHKNLDSRLHSPTPNSMVSLMPSTTQNFLEYLREKFIGCRCMTSRCCKPSPIYQGF